MSESKEEKKIPTQRKGKHAANRQQMREQGEKVKVLEDKNRELMSRAKTLESLVEVLAPSANCYMNALSHEKFQRFELTKLVKLSDEQINKKSIFKNIVQTLTGQGVLDNLHKIHDDLSKIWSGDYIKINERIKKSEYISLNILVEKTSNSNFSSSSSTSSATSGTVGINFEFKDVPDAKGNKVSEDYRAPVKKSTSLVFPRPVFVSYDVSEDQLVADEDYSEGYVFRVIRKFFQDYPVRVRRITSRKVICLELFDLLDSADFCKGQWGAVLQDQAYRFCAADGSINIPYCHDYVRADTAYVYGLYRQHLLQVEGKYDTVRGSVNSVNLNAKLGTFLVGGPDTTEHTLQVITTLTTMPTSMLVKQ